MTTDHSQLFSATVVNLDNNPSVSLVGELDLETARELDNVLAQLIEHGPDSVILDFSRLTFIDSSGLSSVIAARNRLFNQGRRLIVQSPQPNVTRVLKVTAMMDFLNVELGQLTE